MQFMWIFMASFCICSIIYSFLALFFPHQFDYSDLLIKG